ncbi:MAG TPA: hypothetical protein VK190_03100 [Pseudoneobacillus sp.]|nr:hypothetical protein [Pseudoneobacillus sp.]
MSSTSNILGFTVVYDQSSDTSYVSYCYEEDSDIEYFKLEYFDEVSRQWVPYDGKYGIIERDR